ncbi:DRTGG domain-containing protein [Natronincola ferrireducens]|uniref:DRTGG domain-containing protein n=1 Tax=Natronincola ferrireducens TaxID=393762 RepID=A0A1G9D5F9_9FIRM|nr:DRTGG domain-containing protein [Natronincola ferrireducens]SDK58905.1 DRTGG domain-containing protein [Natronincola ferrireducens]
MITVKQLMEKLSLELVGGQQGLDNEISGVYIGDLLSWVMAHLKYGEAWITIQTNINVIAVAALGEAACVIIVESAEIEEVTKNKADEEGIPLLRCDYSAYQLATEIAKLIEIK